MCTVGACVSRWRHNRDFAVSMDWYISMSVYFVLNAGGKKLPAKKIPHQHSSFLSEQNNMISQKKNKVVQRILSARLHKIKELKNEIFDLQQKLEASNLENQILKRLLYRHSKAIGRYENSESVLPDLLTRHYSEVSALRKRLRMSQEEERLASRKIRKVEAELLKAKDDLQALYKLSEDKTLAEREELYHRLSVLTEKIEVNNERIQSLEKQLKLNNSTFSRQLANENKKAAEAGIITKNLQMEINSLHQKIKEKDRQLYIKNIYTNHLLRIPKDKGDLVPPNKKNNQEEDAVEEKEERSEELSKSGKAGSNFLTARNKMLPKLKKQYVFSETTENLYHGLPTSGTKSTKYNLCNHRRAGQDHYKEAESQVKKWFGLHEPSLCRVSNMRQKGSSAEAEGCAHAIFSERKRSLMKELFGQGGVCKDNHSCSNMGEMERKGPFQPLQFCDSVIPQPSQSYTLLKCCSIVRSMCK
uniref:Lebercilin-like protein n=1 Tax=Coturnix japonica TaxID=93934 RepID=A0A8C2T9A1_COTJA